jgi:hypothetical protein
VKYVKDVSAGGYWLYVDGTERIAASGLNTSGQPSADTVRLGLTDYGTHSTTVNIDCVVVSDAYIGPEAEETLIEVGDSLGLSDAILRHKTLSVTDAVGANDVALGNKEPLIVNDAVSLADLVEAITGTIIKTVFDTVGTADIVLMDKQTATADMVSVLDTVSTPSRVLQALEAVGVADGALVRKTLMITETVNLAEVVEVGVGGVKKTRLFLILGDLAVQPTGD